MEWYGLLIDLAKLRNGIMVTGVPLKSLCLWGKVFLQLMQAFGQGSMELCGNKAQIGEEKDITVKYQELMFVNMMVL
jgi:hypothetical protein